MLRKKLTEEGGRRRFECCKSYTSLVLNGSFRSLIEIPFIVSGSMWLESFLNLFISILVDLCEPLLCVLILFWWCKQTLLKKRKLRRSDMQFPFSLILFYTWYFQERDGYWKMMQRYIGADITSMVTLPVVIFEPMTMLQKMAEVNPIPYTFLLHYCGVRRTFNV